jgi:hypothetical protein
MRARRHVNAARGSAMLVTYSLMAILMIMVLGLMAYAFQRRQQAVFVARSMNRWSCAEAGLQLAKNYFGRNFGNWNTYLNNPSVYNPVQASYNTHPAPCNHGGNPAVPPAGQDTCNFTGAAVAAIQGIDPNLFADLDGDGKMDVYIYIRDNADELPPAPQNYLQDNDQNVYVGAICISQTLAPRLGNGLIDPSGLNVEALLSYNLQSTTGSQSLGGSSGTGNFNN